DRTADRDSIAFACPVPWCAALVTPGISCRRDAEAESHGKRRTVTNGSLLFPIPIVIIVVMVIPATHVEPFVERFVEVLIIPCRPGFHFGWFSRSVREFVGMIPFRAFLPFHDIVTRKIG